MPLYEYICSKCSHHFELIVQGSTTPECPNCQTRDIQKQLSAFSVSGGGEDFNFENEGGSCGTCGDPRGPGACALN